MANVIPFKGILYNPDKVGGIKDVVAPPYDVISSEKQQELHDRHPENVVRLILGKAQETDTKEDNAHTRAANYFVKWLGNGVLQEDTTPAYYLTAVEFLAGEKNVTRYGLIARVGLEPFEKGIILPHEQTFSKVKSERLELLKKCKANFSPIFSFYSDKDQLIQKLKNAVADMTPVADIVDDANERHRMWRITDDQLLHQIEDQMKDKKLFIADGHHRYETALNYREWLKENDTDFSFNHPANYVMMYLCSMEDPGLIIFPAHRMVTRIDDQVMGSFIDNASAYFDINPLTHSEDDNDDILSNTMALLAREASKTAFCAVIKDRGAYFLTLKDGVTDRLFGDEIQAVLRNLDVTVLTHLVLVRLLGIDQEGLDNENLIKYSNSERTVVDMVRSGKCDIGFIMNPTRIKQVQDIAESGEIMPRKTTYFYPKAITGLVLNKLF